MITALKLGSRGTEVRVIQTWLTELGYGKPGEMTAGEFDQGTRGAVRKFQADHQLDADGTIGPNTWWEILDTMRWESFLGTPSDNPPGTPRWLANFRFRPFGFPAWNFDTRTFDELYSALFSRAAPPGLHTLLNYLARDTSVGDIRWAAYMLATVQAECGPTRSAPAFEPVEEGVSSRTGKPYNEPQTAPDGTSHRYYGRGYIQLTHKRNYQAMTAALGLTGPDHLVNHPERALDRDIAYKVMSCAFRRGLDGSPPLSHYIGHKQCDYRNARQIINRMDRADEIAGYARKYDLCLTGGLGPC
jgi:putative chitinase